jgi:SAM-dependent methyltransferase
MDLKEDQILGKSVANHWYYRSKAAAMLRFVTHLHAKNLLDVGAGSGFFSKYLLTHTTARAAWCIDPYYPEEREENHAGKPIQFRHECSGTDADLVLMMDVLEHVDDDLALLREYIDKVSSGTHFLITVPAFQFLWSGHDVFLDHYRRYTLPDVTKLIDAAGLVVEQRAYYFGLVFPLAAAMRLAGKLLGHNADEPHSDLKQHNSLTNSLLSIACRAELPVFKFNRLAGLSVFCLARKT